MDTPRHPTLATGALRTVALALALALPLCIGLAPVRPAFAQAPPGYLPMAGDDTVVRARDALRKRDRATLLAARNTLLSVRHPLAPWADYWELGNRLTEATQGDIDSFDLRWPGSYVEDRLRNDWLLELGRRRDWANFRTAYPRFRMNDDREVSCYALLTQHLAGQDVKAAARAAWAAQKEPDDGCLLLGRTLLDAQVLKPDDAWAVARTAVENGRPKTAKAVIALLLPGAAMAVADALDTPARFLARPAAAKAAGVAVAPESRGELPLLALMRLAASDPEAAAAQLEGPWAHRLPLTLAATAWAHLAKGATMKQQPAAIDHARRAWQAWEATLSTNRPGVPPPWSDELLAWQVRAALRQPDGDKTRWRVALKAIDAMSPAEQRDPAWVYWRARAVAALAPAGADGDAGRAASRLALESITGQFNFYGKLALEDLGGRITLPPSPAPATPAERESARTSPGLARALQLIAIGLRSEGVREWNFTLRGMGERELLAVAQLACEREVWDRCINTSDRTRNEIDIAQRFPTPFRDQVVAKARQVGLDPAVLYGVMRQESRFITDARSAVGANGLMQVMPATAKWMAKQLGMAYKPDMATDRDTNLLLGASYLKRVLDDFDGSLALAAAAYNAGPGRPRRWREGGAVMEPAAWAETIPFTETRDYVKKVLSNSVYYAAVLGAAPGSPPAVGTLATVPLPSLKARLGPAVGPSTGLREAGNTAPDRDRETP